MVKTAVATFFGENGLLFIPTSGHTVVNIYAECTAQN